MSLLYYLVNSGMINTYLIEENSIGFHASGRSTGQLMMRGSKLFSEFPEEIGKEYLTFIGENNRRFLNGLRTVSFDNELRECGGLRLAVNEEELAKLEVESKFIQQHRGIECPILSGKNLGPLVPSKKFVGGMFVPNEATFNPYKTVNGLRDVIEKSGTRVFTNATVESVILEDDNSLSVSVRNRGVIKAKQVVYCTGSYTTRLLPEFGDILQPFREQVVATEFVENEVLNTFPTMSLSANDGRERFRTHNSKIIVSGLRQSVRGQQEGITYDGEISQAVYDKIRAYSNDVFPFLSNVKFGHVWSSVLCSTPDGLPLIGPVPGRKNQYVLAGFGCYDSSHAILGGMMIKDYIKNKDSIVQGHSILNPGRFFNAST